MKHSKTPLPGAVLLLAALGFALGTGEFVIVGILPEIAEGLGTSLAPSALPPPPGRCCTPPGGRRPWCPAR